MRDCGWCLCVPTRPSTWLPTPALATGPQLLQVLCCSRSLSVVENLNKQSAFALLLTAHTASCLRGRARTASLSLGIRELPGCPCSAALLHAVVPQSITRSYFKIKNATLVCLVSYLDGARHQTSTKL